MCKENNSKAALLYRLLTLVAVALLAASYFSPVWWVSLKAPQYPDVAFPDGIRIHFHNDSVQNGCKLIKSAEKFEDEALNCKHEMDAINHYVGMFPIAAGGPVERAYSPILFSLLGVMMIGFATPRKFRVGALGVMSAGLAIWMTLAMQTEGGVKYLSPGFVDDIAGTLQINESEYGHWTGLKAIEESYSEALDRYFRKKQENDARVKVMLTAAKVVYWGLLLSLLALVIVVWKVPKFYWALALVPIILPVAFLIEYSAWLWWFGHSLHEMAAFSIKPFMPTVLGDGKVAQFVTHSYPHYGYAFMVASSFCMILAALIRRKSLKETEGRCD